MNWTRNAACIPNSWRQRKRPSAVILFCCYYTRYTNSTDVLYLLFATAQHCRCLFIQLYPCLSCSCDWYPNMVAFVNFTSLNLNPILHGRGINKAYTWNEKKTLTWLRLRPIFTNLHLNVTDFQTTPHRHFKPISCFRHQKQILVYKINTVNSTLESHVCFNGKVNYQYPTWL